MALVVEIKVNRKLLRTVEIKRISNLGQVMLDPETISEYAVTSYFPSGWSQPHGTVFHSYGDSAETLTMKAMAAILDIEDPFDEYVESLIP